MARVPLRQKARALLRRAGLDVHRYSEVLGYDQAPFERRCRLLAHHHITHVIDVGANEGQWALSLRHAGFDGHILSLEPLRRPFELLLERSRPDPRWTCERVAVGEQEGPAVMHVSAHDAGSSLLTVSERLVQNTPQMATVREEEVAVKRLSDVVPDLPGDSAQMLKLDVQGSERQVLSGGLDVLSRFRLIEAELSFEPLYDGEMPFREALDYLSSLGFELATLEPGIDDETTGYPLQVDAFFLRRD
jgi:FkbM family methyltransferase